ncbi:unnamed protein product [Cuscuta epithymum]|uniref:CLAVATA3/ESR-related protein n=1 Tax=Cuscuta epithymum TaxID=186058 RepID=A0AAV0FG47_9ASTE|nr:unnamed protein product [Cuscuta epithymum]
MASPNCFQSKTIHPSSWSIIVAFLLISLIFNSSSSMGMRTKTMRDSDNGAHTMWSQTVRENHPHKISATTHNDGANTMWSKPERPFDPVHRSGQTNENNGHLHGVTLNMLPKGGHIPPSGPSSPEYYRRN